MSNPDDGVEISFVYELSQWELREGGERARYADEAAYHQLWAKVGDYFRDGGAGVVIYTGKFEGQGTLPLSRRFEHRVRVFSESRATAVYKHLQAKQLERQLQEASKVVSDV